MDVSRILVVRPDGIGDVVLTTPAFQLVRKLFPLADLHAWVGRAVLPILEGVSYLNHVTTPPPTMGAASFKSYDRVYFFNSTPGMMFGAWRARVQERIGNRSKLESFLFLNRGLRQSRSRVARHEAEYGLELVSRDPTAWDLRTRITVPVKARGEAQAWLERFELGRDFVLIHPGMKGSAANWPLANYIELGRRLAREGWEVLFSVGPDDVEVRDVLSREVWDQNPRGPRVFDAMGQSFDCLAALLERARLVIAPSTGPLHVAVALGRNVLSFYPHTLVQSPKRWGPFRPEGRAAILQPPAAFPAELQRVQVTDALKEAKRMLES